MTIDIVKGWLIASRDDLLTIKNIISNTTLTHIVAFHSQQSIEKSLKALIESKSQKVPKQHDLLKLKELLRNEIHIDNDDLLDTLNQLYIDSRYPGDMGLLPYGKPTIEDAKEFYEFAKEIFDTICDKLNTEEIKKQL